MMINPMDMTGRVTVVTGASSGIGRAASLLLSQLGARVVLVGRNQDRLSQTLAMLEGSQHSIEVFDLTSTDDIPAWMKLVAQRNGLISGVVHCAGEQLIFPVRMLKSQQVEELLRINVVSAIMLAKSFRQHGVNDSGGAIVFVSSVMGEVGAPGRSAYCASKGALHSLTKSLAMELAKERIRVNCVAPGTVKTEMLDEAQNLLTDAQIAEIESMQPLGFGTPRDIAHALVFLLAETGRWITGSVLIVDGGYTAH